MSKPLGSIQFSIPDSKLGFPLAAATKKETIFRQYKIGPIKNQQDNPWCVGFSLYNLLCAEPIVQTPFSPEKIYKEARKRDPENSDEVSGAKLNLAVDFLKEKGVIKNEHWTTDAEEVGQYIFNISPVVLSIPWKTGMDEVDKSGKMKIGGKYRGHHAVMAYAFDGMKDRVYFVNQWGEDWGDNGRFTLSLADLKRLMNDGGIACALIEK